MDQTKVGSFLKGLRKEKGFTQEQLAEKLNTTGRTVSRWETGNNLPDITMLVELADLYDVDIREIIDGERKSENMTEETRDVLGKVSEYVDVDKQKKARWVRNTSIIGLTSLFLALIVQSIMLFRAPDTLPLLIGIIMTFVAFVTLFVVALYANGVAKSSKAFKVVKWILIVSGAYVCLHVISVLVVFAVVFLYEMAPANSVTTYDKAHFVTEYGSDMDTGLYLFPEDTTKMTDVSFNGSFDVGMFDTEGFLILSGTYSEEDYLAEVERLGSVTCTIKDITLAVKYDASSYSLPAYVACDGFDYSYEYALLDADNHRITYVFINYPNVNKPSAYSSYLKKDKASYSNGALSNFTIYAYSFDNGESYLEFNDNL